MPPEITPIPSSSLIFENRMDPAFHIKKQLFQKEADRLESEWVALYGSRENAVTEVMSRLPPLPFVKMRAALNALFRGEATQQKLLTVIAEYPFLALAMVQASPILQEITREAEKLLELTYGLSTKDDQLIIVKKSAIKIKP